MKVQPEIVLETFIILVYLKNKNALLHKHIFVDHFLFTNSTQISRLGPQLTLFSRDLCVSLLVTTCDVCEMTFFYQNSTTRKTLKTVGPTKVVLVI